MVLFVSSYIQIFISSSYIFPLLLLPFLLLRLPLLLRMPMGVSDPPPPSPVALPTNAHDAPRAYVGRYVNRFILFNKMGCVGSAV